MYFCKYFYYMFVILFKLMDVGIVENFLQNKIHHILANFWANFLKCISLILWPINIYAVKGNLTIDSLGNNLLGYFNGHLIFFIFFILANVNSSYRTRFDRYNVSNIFFYENAFYKYSQYWPINEFCQFFSFHLAAPIKVVFIYHLSFVLLK